MLPANVVQRKAVGYQYGENSMIAASVVNAVEFPPFWKKHDTSMVDKYDNFSFTL